MIAPKDLGLIGLTARRLEEAAPNEEPPMSDPHMTYEIGCDNGVWRILFHGRKIGRFESFDAALAFARRLARECAALGTTACVALQPHAPPAKREIFPARVM